VAAAGLLEQPCVAGPAERPLRRALTDTRDLGQLLYGRVAFPALIEQVGQDDEHVESASAAAARSARVLFDAGQPPTSGQHAASCGSCGGQASSATMLLAITASAAMGPGEHQKQLPPPSSRSAVWA